ncbi:MAG: sugar phosphate isomerase/epimerase [Oscillospiraceae bacterium]|nr:sugar phosphate isomerase/epimerase [Oscillospiraceae bacterium]
MLKAALIGFYNMKSENDPWATIEKLSKWGYKALEHGGFLLKGDVQENLKKLSEYDFSVLSVSTDIDGLKNNLDDIIAKATAIKVKNVICFWSDPQNYEEAIEIAGIFEKAGEKLRGEDLTFCYHNHNHEFEKSFNGVKYFDILMANTSPENVCLNLDIGWVSFGGENAVELIKRVKDRIKLMHFKDFYDFNDRNSFTSLGTGKVKIQEILAEAAKLDIEYITVEQDVLRNLNADDTVLLSYLTLKESGLVE